MTKKEIILDDIKNIEECLERTVNRTDIWQDRIIHNLATAIWHILQWEYKKCK